MTYTDEIFNKVDFTKTPLAKGEYEYCSFMNCNLYHIDLTGIRFLECTFSTCNLSLAQLDGTSLMGTQFKDCKMLGLRFDKCDDFAFAVHLDSCTLDHSSFYGRKLKKTVFKQCKLQEVDFSTSDLGQAVFGHCDLYRAIFGNSNLEKADFRTSFNFSIDPARNRVKKAKFSREGLAGLLDKYDISIE